MIRDLVLTRSVPFVTLLQIAAGGSRIRRRARLFDRIEIVRILGDVAQSIDLDAVDVLLVSAGHVRRPNATASIRSIVTTRDRDGSARVFVHVEERPDPFPLSRRGGNAGLHVVACERLPAEPLFVDCPPHERPRPARVVAPLSLARDPGP
jgi:hypothetical protein